MAFIPAENVAETRLIYRVGAFEWSNEFYWEGDGAWDESSLATLTNTVEEAWAEGLNALFTTECTLYQIHTRDLTIEDGLTVDLFPTSGNAGTRVGTLPPLNVAMSITRRSATTGRSSRGRIYHYGLHTGDLLDEKNWLGSVAAQASAALMAFESAVALGSNGSGVIVSTQEGNVVLAEAVMYPITLWIGRTQVATKRKRVR